MNKYKLLQSYQTLRAEYKNLKESYSSRLGFIITWPFRLIYNTMPNFKSGMLRYSYLVSKLFRIAMRNPLNFLGQISVKNIVTLTKALFKENPKMILRNLNLLIDENEIPYLHFSVFNLSYYTTRYHELKGLSSKEVKIHWLDFGIKEGRCASVIFDVNYYLRKNQDIQQAFGRDYQKVIMHWLNHGLYEKKVILTCFQYRFLP